MSQDMYKKLKKQNGETFAQGVRNFHNGILEIPDLDVIVRHAGRKAEPVLPYLMSLLAANDAAESAVLGPRDPFALLDEAGYDAFYADTLEKQNSIQRYFKKSELLCTFDDHARHKNYHIVHAVKKDADQIKREDFKGNEQREDAYGTSVISIQMLKSGGFISIKNRYNHAVLGCDHTFGSNPDNIIEGLSSALKEHFDVDFNVSGSLLPYGYVTIGEQIFKYNYERNNIYYGDNAWIVKGKVHTVNKAAGDALFDGFIFNNKTKTLIKIDTAHPDKFADDFNRYYGGNPGLAVQGGNLTLNGEVLIGADRSQIKTLYLPEFKEMSEKCLYNTNKITSIHLPALKTMGPDCCVNADNLLEFKAPALTRMGNNCFVASNGLTVLDVSALRAVGKHSFCGASSLTELSLPALVVMGNGSFKHVTKLTQLYAPVLTRMGDQCFQLTNALERVDAPSLTAMGTYCFYGAMGIHGVMALKQFDAPLLTTMGDFCFAFAKELTQFYGPSLTAMGECCFRHASNLTVVNVPEGVQMGRFCFEHVPALTCIRLGLQATMNPFASDDSIVLQM